ncbi:hypothetical protein MRX96_049627, partial [Rhipicephalus microplus]
MRGVAPAELDALVRVEPPKELERYLWRCGDCGDFSSANAPAEKPAYRTR